MAVQSMLAFSQHHFFFASPQVLSSSAVMAVPALQSYGSVVVLAAEVLVAEVEHPLPCVKQHTVLCSSVHNG